MTRPHNSDRLHRGKASAIVLDCDGVLLDTVDAKLRAFVDWVPQPLSQHRIEFGSHCRRRFGSSRAVLITEFYQAIAREPITPDALREEIDRFGVIVDRYVAEARWLPGALEFVECVAHRNMDMYVLSGAPQSDLVREMASRGVAGCFREIIGAPARKQDVLERLCARYGGDPRAIWMVGDGKVDRDAAMGAGTTFIQVQSSLGEVEGNHLKLTSLIDLTAYLDYHDGST